MEEAGQKLKRVRERLNLRYRDVEEASLRIAQRQRSDEFILGLSRLADIENKGVLPTLYRLYSLCAIYRLDPIEVMRWYGVDVSGLPSDAAQIEVERTHPIGFNPNSHGQVTMPLSLDPGVDLRRTTYISRVVQRWGKLPLMLLDGLDLEEFRYGFIGTDDMFMYPMLQPGSLVLIDESKRKVVDTGWTSEYERPIYFLEHKEGWAVGWCHMVDSNQLVLHPHPASRCSPLFFKYPQEIEIIGQITGVAMRLNPVKKRRARSASG